MNPGNLAEMSRPEWIGRPTHEELDATTHPVLPAADPFHRPPPGYQHAAPGTVLRTRDVALAFLGLIPVRAAATQLLYRTTDMHGNPEAAVTTVIAPAGRTATTPVPLLSYQCAIDAVSSRCFPSYALRRGARAFGSLPQLEFLMIAAALAQGWAVSVPDHEGCNGSWGSPFEPGYRVLDGVRAALSAERLGFAPQTPVGMWGYSGGGLATAWAAELCAVYAPELDIVGAALGSPVGDLGHTFRRLNGTFFAALPALVITSLTHCYPGLERIVAEHVTEEGRAVLHSLESMTTIEALFRLRGTDMDALVDQPLADILAMPEVQHVFTATKLGTAIPAPPVLLMQAVHDEVISIDDIDALADTYLAGGANISYHRDPFSEHVLLHPFSLPMTLNWLADRFAGRPLTANRVRTSWPALLNPATYTGMARLAVTAARVLTGKLGHHRGYEVTPPGDTGAAGATAATRSGSTGG